MIVGTCRVPGLSRSTVDLPQRPAPAASPTPHRLAASALLTLGAGLAVTAILAAGVLHLEQDKQALAFERQAGIRTAAIRRGLDQALEVVTVTNTLFRTVGDVSESQFHIFTAPLIERNRFIKAFTYHQRLLDADRPAFEAALARNHPGSTVREMRGGRAQSSLRHPVYNPALFVEPYAGNEAAYGFDVATSKTFSDA